MSPRSALGLCSRTASLVKCAMNLKEHDLQFPNCCEVGKRRDDLQIKTSAVSSHRPAEMRIQRRCSEGWKNSLYQDSLRELGLFGMDKRKLQKDLRAPFST